MPSPIEPANPDRYRLGAEIARGGLGRVLEATDRALGRAIAVKVVLEGLSEELQERFLREACLTARLDHPNVVPVHDVREASADGQRQLMLCMKRIHGRDLGELLKAIARGERGAREAWTRPRLLRVLQDICLGVAYAHSKGIVHRDLKPSNVMIGDYGETLIVDWGLARETGIAGTEAGGTGRPEGRPGGLDVTRVPDSVHTIEGAVVGTPQYMAPEQAAGRLADVDERSDIYALGAILYEILTLKPPVEADSLDELLEKTRSGVIVAPSARLPSGLPAAGVGPIPPDLDAICMKAMALRREDRFQSARQLHDEIQLYLEGVKERERAHGLAETCVARAREAMDRYRRLAEEAAAALVAAEESERKPRPLDDKAEMWALEDRARGLEREAVEAFAGANALLTEALGHERGHEEARRLKAELYWTKFLEAEEAGSEREMVLSERIVEEFNDGAFDGRLKGEGTLTVRTRAWGCACLREGREVGPGEFRHGRYHPLSGRSLDGRPEAAGVPELESLAPRRLKVHGAGCGTVPVAGAHVWLWRYEEIGRLLIPTTPSGVPSGRSPFPAPVAEAFLPGSPFVPRGPGAYLGATPVEGFPLPMGSWLLLVSADGAAPVRCPVAIPRCGACEQQVTLFRRDEIPEGQVAIPEGPFGFQGDRENPYSNSGSTPHVGDFFIARDPVTCRQYAEFLNDLEATRPGEAAKRAPRESDAIGSCWPGPAWIVPSAAAPAGVRAASRRLPGCAADWEDDWPVFGVSWEDAVAYCAWRTGREGRLVVLPHEVEWEKAARGTDRRWFPFGRHFDDRWCNTSRSHAGGARPARVDEFPHDESPYGVRGMSGNSRDACLNDSGPEYAGWRIFRGGTWVLTGFQSRVAARTGSTAQNTSAMVGFRTASAIRIPSAPEAP
ncbi:MAG: SUMF1/EgtB/PvdO family nonheme iron enzyme [Planctomycetes bacterium]|nr:SUMF1/EgtB/PvdO family nonheme iron enzyme [Planctomycetota bacterium]